MHVRRHRLAIALALAFAASVAASSVTSSDAGLREVPTTGGGTSPGAWCGPLWQLATLSDADRDRVRLDRVPTSIADLAAVTPPSTIGPRRNSDFERHTWRLRIVVDRYRIGSNGEIVFVLYSIPTGDYMNAYLPNPNCLSARTRDRTGIVAARREFTQHCPHATASWQLLGASVDLTGVGFWNPLRITRGALRNGAELRPLTNLEIISGCGIASG